MMTDFHDVVAFSWELDWNSLCVHGLAGVKCSWKEFYSLWPWAGLTGSQRGRFTLSSHAFRCISPFPIKPADSSIHYGSISRLPRGKEQLCRTEEESEKTSSRMQLNSLCQNGSYIARLGQQSSTLCLNATCQILINCLGFFYTCLICISNPTKS